MGPFDGRSFGGKNPNSIYVPMSEDEQEVLQRLAETRDLKVIIKGWGFIDQPRTIVGDMRVCVEIDLTFNAPATPRKVFFLDLELRTLSSNLLLFAKRMSTVYDNLPLEVSAGVRLCFAWDIAIHHMDPALVRAIKPGALGLTSRRLDKDTGDPTLRGNMLHLTPAQQEVLYKLQQGEALVRRLDTKDVVKATLNEGAPIKQTPDGIEAPDVE